MQSLRLAPAVRTVLPLLLLLAAACDKKGTDAGQAPETSQAEAAPPSGADKAQVGQTTPNGLPGAPSGQVADPGQATAGASLAPPSTREEETITLLAPGAEPRQALRYSYKKGRTKSFTMQMELQMSALTEGAPAQAMPPTTFEFGGKTTTRELLPNGGAIRDTTFTSFLPRSPEIPPQMAEQMEAQMKSFEGMKMTETITALGKVETVEVDESTVKSEQAQMFLRNLMEGMSNAFLPLPTEAVGVGAKWDGKTIVEASGIKVTQTGHFELTAIKGSKATIRMTFDQAAPSQEVVDPAMNPMLKTELLSMKGEGTGETQVDLKSLLTRGHVELSTATQTRVTSREQPAADPALPNMPAGLGGQARSVTSTLTTKVKVTMKID